MNGPVLIGRYDVEYDDTKSSQALLCFILYYHVPTLCTLKIFAKQGRNLVEKRLRIPRRVM